MAKRRAVMVRMEQGMIDRIASVQNGVPREPWIREAVEMRLRLEEEARFSRSQINERNIHRPGEPVK